LRELYWYPAHRKASTKFGRAGAAEFFFSELSLVQKPNSALTEHNLNAYL